MDLFAGRKACFSPLVSRLLKIQWINSGGSLVQSPEDFARADTFFCNGIDDPWTRQLLSRSLIVIHPDWIAKCISQAFLFPISKFVLDALYDSYSTTRPGRASMDVCFPIAISSPEPLKRAHDQMDQSFEPAHRPIKRQRFSKSSSPLMSNTKPQQPSPPSSPLLKRIDLRQISARNSAVSAFKKLIKPRTLDAIWADINIQYLTCMDSGPPRLPLHVLLDTPDSISTAFDTRKLYQGKAFSCSKLCN